MAAISKKYDALIQKDSFLIEKIKKYLIQFNGRFYLIQITNAK